MVSSGRALGGILEELVPLLTFIFLTLEEQSCMSLLGQVPRSEPDVYSWSRDESGGVLKSRLISGR